MTLVTMPAQHREAVKAASPIPDKPSLPSDDGSRQLLQAGCWILLVGVAAALLALTAFGGIGVHGPHTNSGWLALIVAMMCLPFGTMLTLLGGAKWLRLKRLRD